MDRASIELAAGFRAGDDDAIRLVYRRHGGAMYSVARSILGDSGLAADAVHQAFLQAWRAAETFDGSRPMGPWLAQITRRVCIDRIRRDARRPRSAALLERDAAWIDETASIDDLDLVWMVREAVDRLPPDERALVRLVYMDGYSFGEAARRLGAPVGTVKSRTARARSHLASALAHLAPASDPEPLDSSAGPNGLMRRRAGPCAQGAREEMSDVR